jgi:hypothetical protein
MITMGSSFVQDSHAISIDQGQPVSGEGIPKHAYVGTVSPGVSFTLVNSAGKPVTATKSGTFTITIGTGGETPTPYDDGAGYGLVKWTNAELINGSTTTPWQPSDTQTRLAYPPNSGVVTVNGQEPAYKVMIKLPCDPSTGEITWSCS